MNTINHIDPTVALGEGCQVWHFAVVLAGTVLGRNVSVGSRVEIGRGSTIGDNTRIGSGAFLPANSKVGNGVFIGPNVTFTDDRWPIAGNYDYVAEPPNVGDFASIGAGAVILPGVIIGAHAMIGAGAVVAHHVEPGGVVRGEPAKLRRVISQPHPLHRPQALQEALSS
jgi:acetyltransferase-like isoleucine patch superfamily enzyme